MRINTRRVFLRMARPRFSKEDILVFLKNVLCLIIREEAST
jgi:hypothetical protein